MAKPRRVLTISAGSGAPPVANFTSDDFDELGAKLGADIAEAARQALNDAVKHMLYFQLPYPDAAEGIAHFEKIMAQIEALDRATHALASDGERHAKTLIERSLERARSESFLADKLPDLTPHQLLHYLWTQYREAKRIFEEDYVISQSARERQRAERVLIIRLADISDSVGVTPTDAYNEYSESENKRETPFVSFVSLVFRKVGEKTGREQALKPYWIRDELARRRERLKAAQPK